MKINDKKWHEIRIKKKDGREYVYKSHSYRENKQVKSERKLLGIVGVDGKFRKSKSHPSNYKTIREYGQTILMHTLAEKSGLVKCLKVVFPDICNELLTCAYFCLVSNMQLSDIQIWIDDYVLPFQKLNLCSQRVSELYSSINEERVMEFLKIWCKQKLDNEYLAYDTTSISTYSNNIVEAEFGFNKDHDSLKQVNLALLSGYNTGIPYFYRIIHGSVKDVSTLVNLIKYAEQINMKNIKLVMDRGFYKNNNVSLLNIKNYDYIIGLPFSNKIAKSLVHEVADKIGDSQNFLHIGAKEACYGITKEIVIDEIKITAHIYLDKTKKAQLEEDFLIDINTFNEINKDKEWSSLSPDGLRKYFIETQNHKLGAINHELIKEVLRYKGFFILITNHQIDIVKALEIYRNKDCVERDFLNLKSRLTFNRLRIHNSNTLNGKMFISFITLILKCYIDYLMKKTKLYKDFTFNTLMYEIHKLKVITFKQGNPIYSEINKKIKTIFDCLEIPLPKNLE